MIGNKEIDDEYFEWLYKVVDNQSSYRNLLYFLYRTTFEYRMPQDKNRAADGIDLRYRFVEDCKLNDIVTLKELPGPCTVLEMMVALAIRCEETIMNDPEVGDRTKHWFWVMIANLQLGAMTDDHFDVGYVANRIQLFLKRDYKPNGEGGLFQIDNCKYDLRMVEIWYQLCWYLDNIIEEEEQ